MRTISTRTRSAQGTRTARPAKHACGVWAIALAALGLLGFAWQPAQAQWGGDGWGAWGGMGEYPPSNDEYPYGDGEQNLGSQILQAIPQIIDAIPWEGGDEGYYGHHHDYGHDYGNSGYYVYPAQPVQERERPVPQETPKANKVVEQPVDVVANASPQTRMRAASDTLIDALKDQIEGKTDKEVQKLQAIMDQKQPPLAESAAKLGAKYSPLEKMAILERAKKGDLDGVLFATTGDNSPEAAALRDYARAKQALNEVRDAVVDGTLTNAQRAKLNGAMVAGGFMNPGNQLQFQSQFSHLDKNNELAALVNSALPGGNVGPVSTIVLVGSMGTSDIVFLGNGTALVGTQGATGGVVIAPGTTAQALGMAAGNGDPVSEWDGNPIPGGAYIVNRSPTEVNFVVAGKRYNLGPDRMKAFALGQNTRIEFYSQGDSELKSYKLEEGTFDFKYADGKWELRRQNYSVTLDNADNAEEFNYVVNNQRQTLAAGSQQTHTSKYPLVFRFDNGKGEVKQKRVISGSYRVAVTEAGMLDMFRASDVTAPLAVDELAAPTHAVAFDGDWDKGDERRTTMAARRTDSKDDVPSLFD